VKFELVVVLRKVSSQCLLMFTSNFSTVCAIRKSKEEQAVAKRIYVKDKVQAHSRRETSVCFWRGLLTPIAGTAAPVGRAIVSQFEAFKL
jgi:hypothetical protein